MRQIIKPLRNKIGEEHSKAKSEPKIHKNDGNLTSLYTYWDAVFQKSLVQMTLGKRA